MNLNMMINLTGIPDKIKAAWLIPSSFFGLLELICILFVFKFYRKQN